MSGTPESKTPGELIAGARRQRGFSVDDLAERTKIPPTMLVALEADEYHRLSGPLYAKSFLRTCARELGLSPDDILDLYAKHIGETPRPVGEPVGVEETVRIRRVGLPWLRMSAGALVVVAIAVTAFVLTRPGTDEPALGPAAAGVAGEATMTGQGSWPREEPAAPLSTPAPADGFVPEDPLGGDVPLDAGSRADASGAPAGVPGLAFSDGLTWPLVVRLRVAAPITARARRDGDERFADVVWPTSGTTDPVPETGVVAGHAYAAGSDLVVYWGAVDRLSLVAGAADDIELTVNGEPRPVSLPADGGEVILDLRAAAPARLP